MHSPAQDVVRTPFPTDWGEVDVTAEQVHVELELVVVHVLCPSLSREATAYKGHAGVQALHGIVQTMMCFAPHHGVSVTQLLLIGLQKLTHHHHYRRSDSHPPEGKRLKKLGRQEGMPTGNYA